MLGFSRGEVSRLLLGEQVLLTPAGMPAGLLLGYGLAWLVAFRFESDLFRIPLVIRQTTIVYSLAVVTRRGAALGAGCAASDPPARPGRRAEDKGVGPCDVQRKHLWYAAGIVTMRLARVRMLRPETIPVDVAPVTVGPLVVTVGDEGQTRVRHRHGITAPLPGRLQRITLEVGDTVTAGMVVARLAPLPLDARSRQQAEAALETARDMERMSLAAVDEARTALEQARQDRVRGAELASRGGLAPADLERLELIERARERGVESAVAQAQAAAHDVEAGPVGAAGFRNGGGRRHARLICPIGGRVLAIPERSERTVAAGRATARGRRSGGPRNRGGPVVHRRREGGAGTAAAADRVGR